LTKAIRSTGQFDRDLKKARKRGKELDKLWSVVTKLADGEPLPPRYRSHRLSGEWNDHRECHLEPDWLLVWYERETELVLVRLGTHADLFD
jgi:mRNA interferase YafQ